MKWWDRFVDKLIEPTPRKPVRTKEELLRLIEEAEREQLKEIFRSETLIEIRTHEV